MNTDGKVSARREYHKPRLVVYGSLKEFIACRGALLSDGTDPLAQFPALSEENMGAASIAAPANLTTLNGRRQEAAAESTPPTGQQARSSAAS